MKMNRKQPFGCIGGTYEKFPNARFEQGGIFFNAQGEACEGQDLPAAAGAKAAPKPKKGTPGKKTVIGAAKAAEDEAAHEANTSADDF